MLIPILIKKANKILILIISNQSFIYISKELKLKLLLDINTKNNDIEQIKRVLESDTKKRRKACNNIFIGLIIF